jgi:hypothetical protein
MNSSFVSRKHVALSAALAMLLGGVLVLGRDRGGRVRATGGSRCRR